MTLSAIRHRCRIMLVDDHPLVRQGMRQTLAGQGTLDVVGEASGEEEALEVAAETNPDIVIVDLSLTEGSGLSLVKQLHQRDASIRTLVCSMYDEVLYGERALRAGAMGYLQKETACDQLVAAIERVREGGFFLSQDLSDRLIMAMVSASEARSEAGTPFERLSDRELEVLELLGKGHTTRTAADHLGLSVKTVETYRENIKDKLALEHNNELICCAAHWVADTA